MQNYIYFCVYLCVYYNVNRGDVEMSKILLEDTRSLNEVNQHSRSVILPPHMVSMSKINEEDKEVRVLLVEDDDRTIHIQIRPKN